MTAVPDLPVYGPTHWTLDALCAQTDPECFFPAKGGTAFAAAKVCRACPVTSQCLEATLAIEETSPARPFGFAGGVSANGRLRILNNRRAA